MRSTQNVVERENGAGLGHYSDPPLLVLASLASGPKHGHAMIEDIAGMITEDGLRVLGAKLATLQQFAHAGLKRLKANQEAL